MDPARWERLLSPLFTVPADSSFVTVEFNICTDTKTTRFYKLSAMTAFFSALLTKPGTHSAFGIGGGF